TDVCGQTYLTDFVGGTPEGQALGFSAHYFTNTASTHAGTRNGYQFLSLGRFISREPVDPSSEAFRQSYKAAYEQLPLPWYTRLGIIIGKWLED
ncbi:MAG TPA: hypothetical protein VJC18_11580, partial [bacterium]|nr:hypothetical protein [bacterium]